MACPKCGCKTTYQYDNGDDFGQSDDRLERCAACGHVFDVEDHADEEEDELMVNGLTKAETNATASVFGLVRDGVRACGGLARENRNG